MANLTSTGVTAGRIGRSTSVQMNSTLAGQSGSIFINDWTSVYNQDAEIFTNVVSGSVQGLKTLLAGTYHFSWTVYMENFNSNAGYTQQHISTGASAYLAKSYFIVDAASVNGEWSKYQHSTIIDASANDIHGIRCNRSVGTYTVSGLDSTTLTAIYLGPTS
tara:strand:+ start:134 stop:619 length:486 start_codon:yes stop_codon:yes gene_type:complete